MEIVYAAEKDSIARLLSEQIESPVAPEQIVVAENPNETGSFLIGFEFERFMLTPAGALIRESLELAD